MKKTKIRLYIGKRKSKLLGRKRIRIRQSKLLGKNGRNKKKKSKLKKEGILC